MGLLKPHDFRPVTYSVLQRKSDDKGKHYILNLAVEG